MLCSVLLIDDGLRFLSIINFWAKTDLEIGQFRAVGSISWYMSMLHSSVTMIILFYQCFK